MKSVEVDYGPEKINISVPETATVARFNNPTPNPNPELAVRRALDCPYGAPPLRHLIRPDMKVAIAHDDPTKPGPPFQIVLNVLIDILLSAGVEKKNISLISANGNHKKWSSNELKNFLGERIFNTFHPLGNVKNHDCRDREKLICLGRTPGGAIVDHNRDFLEADLLLYAGQIVAHSWGGYTGTGAAIGLASTRSIASHHNFDVVNHPKSTIGDQKKMYFRKLKAEINYEIEKKTKKNIFYVNWVGGVGGKIVDVFAGFSPAVETPAWELADTFSIVNVPQADILVVGLPQNFAYGSSDNPLITSIGMAYPTRVWLNNHLLRNGGCVIGLNPCSGDYDTETYVSTPEVLELRSKVSCIKELTKFQNQVAENKYYLEKYSECHAYHPIHPFWLLYSCEYMMNRTSEVFIAGSKADTIFKSLGMNPIDNFEDAFSLACQKIKKDPEVVVVPHYWSERPFKFFVEK